MKSYYVYILLCSDNSYYTGITNNLESRILQHNSAYDRKCYTAKRLPVQLVYSQQLHEVMQAISLEKQIKGWSRKKKEALINSDWEQLKQHSKNYTQFPKEGDEKK